MKTAEEYLKEENCISNDNGVFIYERGYHRINVAVLLEDYAKLYANQKLDEAANKVKYNPLLRESILSLKDEI